MVAMKALAGSTPLAWVKVATWTLVSVPDFVRTAPETLIAGSANDVVTLALLLAGLGSGLLPLTVAGSLELAPLLRPAGAEAATVRGWEAPGGMWAVAFARTLPRDCPPKKRSVPAVCVIDTKVEPAGSRSDRTTPWAALGPLLVMVTVYVAS